MSVKTPCFLKTRGLTDGDIIPASTLIHRPLYGAVPASGKDISRSRRSRREVGERRRRVHRAKFVKASGRHSVFVETSSSDEGIKGREASRRLSKFCKVFVKASAKGRWYQTSEVKMKVESKRRKRGRIVVRG